MPLVCVSVFVHCFLRFDVYVTWPRFLQTPGFFGYRFLGGRTGRALLRTCQERLRVLHQYHLTHCRQLVEQAAGHVVLHQVLCVGALGVWVVCVYVCCVCTFICELIPFPCVRA